MHGLEESAFIWLLGHEEPTFRGMINEHSRRRSGTKAFAPGPIGRSRSTTRAVIKRERTWAEIAATMYFSTGL